MLKVLATVYLFWNLYYMYVAFTMCNCIFWLFQDFTRSPAKRQRKHFRKILPRPSTSTTPLAAMSTSAAADPSTPLHTTAKNSGVAVPSAPASSLLQHPHHSFSATCISSSSVTAHPPPATPISAPPPHLSGPSNSSSAQPPARISSVAAPPILTAPLLETFQPSPMPTNDEMWVMRTIFFKLLCTAWSKSHLLISKNKYLRNGMENFYKSNIVKKSRTTHFVFT